MAVAAAPARIVRAADLQAAAEIVGTGFRIVTREAASESGALSGDYRLVRLRPGLAVHASDTVELHDLTTEVVQEAGLTCALLMAGEADFELGGRPYRLAPPPGTGWPCGHLILRQRPQLFTRRSHRGTRMRKVHITVSPEWLGTGMPELADLLGGRAAGDVVHRQWQPSAQAVTLAEEILTQPVQSDHLAKLFLESRATGILFEALSNLAPSPGEVRAEVGPRDQRRVEAACELLKARLGEHVPLEEVAREVGASLSTLQRLFHAVHGTSVYGYVREQKLLEARLALQKGEMKVAEAAHLAGYANPANFATAFKRRFGLSPSEARGACPHRACPRRRASGSAAC